MIDLSNHVQPFWKPAGWSSFDVIRELRSVVSAKKIGHAGTLDPFATGVLVICFGKATKRSAELMEWDKEYVATIQLGTETDTLDPTGKITRTGPVPPMDESMIHDALAQFNGWISQVPPMFSALRRGGKRLYKLARLGENIPLDPRPVRIDNIELVKWDPPDSMTLRITCGKGTYIRALARDIAVVLGTVGHLDQLVRTRVGPYSEQEAMQLSELDQWTPIEA